jgi:transposase
MAAAIALRGDYESAQLRNLARQSEDADQVRRLLALALVYDGGSRSAGARAGGVGLQTFRDWVLRFNAKGPAGLVDGKAPGQVPRLDRAQRGELAQLVEDGPILGVHGVVRWRLSDLAAWVMEKYRTSISEQTISRYLREMGYRKLSARPRHHAQNREAVMVPGRGPDRTEEQDHPSLGQARQPTVRTARPPHCVELLLWRDLPRARGRRRARAAVVQQRHDEPAPRGGLPGSITRRTRRGPARSGWLASSPKLNVPANISLLALPPKSPELKPTENVWQYLRDNWLSNRVFTSARDIVDHCCDAWNRLIDQPWTIMSIGLREWAYR